MDVNFNIGQKLIVELEKECYIGDLHLISKDRNRLELSNVSDFQTQENVRGIQIFYKSDIKSIKQIKSDCVVQSPQLGENHTSSELSNDLKETETILLRTYEIDEIEKCCRNAQYIFKTDRLFHDAIKNIRYQNEVVLNVDGCHVGRSTRTSIITVATRQNVYIFDILSLGQIYPELKDILEANKPRKIIHDSRKIVDNFKYRHSVQIKGIFDTYYAHVGTGGDKLISSLTDCVKKYFNLPENYFISNKDVNWQVRPFDSDRKMMTSKQAMFTFTLYDCLLHDHILKNTYKKMDVFASIYSSNADSVEVASSMASNANISDDEIEDIHDDLADCIEEINR